MVMLYAKRLLASQIPSEEKRYSCAGWTGALFVAISCVLVAQFQKLCAHIRGAFAFRVVGKLVVRCICA